MSEHKYLSVDEQLHKYILENNKELNPVLLQLFEETQKLPEAKMQTDRLQARLLQWLIRLRGVKNVLELGTFTGYSALAMAIALPADGQVHTCDVSKEWTVIARQYWNKAHKSHKIKLRIAPALDTLIELKKENRIYGLVYIDADKENYIKYYEGAMSLLRPNGLMVIDNTLWSGKVADVEAQDEETRTIRELNSIIKNDPRVDAFLLPLGDGMTIIRRK
jgi:predicted O-methyltransferase YrrM